MGNTPDKVSIEDEVSFLAEHTSLTAEDVRELHADYAKRNRITKKEFLHEFKRTFPRWCKKKKRIIQ